MTERVDNCPKGPPGPIVYRDKRMDFSHGPIVMGVLNITPDSFYDGGWYEWSIDEGNPVETGVPEASLIKTRRY